MKVLGKIPDKPLSFPELLKGMLKLPEFPRHRMLRMAFLTGYFSNDVLLTKMVREERDAVAKIHWDALASDSAYAKLDDSRTFGLETVLPKRLGGAAESFRIFGGGDDLRVMSVEGVGRRYYAEARSCLTLNERFPAVVWRFAVGDDYWTKPLVLFRGGSGLLADGLVLGVLAPVPLDDPDRRPAVGTNVEWRRVRDGHRWRYVEC